MGFLIDTSVLIASERGTLDAHQLGANDARTNRPLAVAAITASEILHGMHRAQGVRRAQMESLISVWLRALRVLPFDLEVARVHAALGAELKSAGTPIGSHDLMIAATAVRHGLVVATRDRRSFHRVDGLPVEYW